MLRYDLSPLTVAAVVAAVGERRETSATFYRNEAVPTSPPGQCGSILCGPYALVQGRMAALSSTPTEGQPTVRRGHVARVQRGADFFVALEEHAEWGHAFTVWGGIRMLKVPPWRGLAPGSNLLATSWGLTLQAPGCATHYTQAAETPRPR